MFFTNFMNGHCLPLGPRDTEGLSKLVVWGLLLCFLEVAGSPPRNPGFVLHLFVTWPIWGELIYLILIKRFGIRTKHSHLFTPFVPDLLRAQPHHLGTFSVNQAGSQKSESFLTDFSTEMVVSTKTMHLLDTWMNTNRVKLHIDIHYIHIKHSLAHYRTYYL